MPILSAENQFRQGLTALVDNDPASAAVHFHTAMQIERQRAVARPQTRYLSYYGLSVAQSQGPTPEAIRACETAARLDFFNPDLLLNLGRVYQLAGKVTRALEAFERGLKLAPTHAALRAELAKADRRTRPPLSVVPRQHPVNRALGKLRAAVKTRNPRYVMPTSSA
jgi:tetratricopeptide (TPR) repeat protein